jgi:hypothetical protein
MIAEAERADVEPWDGIRDAFAPVRDLVEGPERLVPPDIYRQYREVTERVLARVSCVRSEEQWALLCFAGTAIGAPRWAFCRDGSDVVTADLEVICRELRLRLGSERWNLEPTEVAMRWLDAAVARVHRSERELLPRRKQRALEEMEIVLNHYRVQCEARGRHEDAQQLRAILDAMENEDPNLWLNWDVIAERWLDLIRPAWYAALSGRRKQARPLLLKDVRQDLLHGKQLELSDVLRAFVPVPTLQPLDERLAACVLGVRT